MRHQLAEQIPSVATAATVTNVRFVPYIFMKFGHRRKTDCLSFYKHSLNFFKTVVLPEINISFFSSKINLYSLSKISAFLSAVTYYFTVTSAMQACRMLDSCKNKELGIMISD